MQIIPAIDIIDGKCVRLTQGNFTQKKIYNDNPLEVAKQFQDAGLKRLHLVDLDGAKNGKVTNWKVLEEITNHTHLLVDFGGGITKEDDIKTIFNLGAAFATIGSLAVKNEALLKQWLQQYGAQKFLLGADVRNEKITIHGWAETTNITVYDFIKNYSHCGVQSFFCTDVSKDGLLQGTAIDLYKNIIAQFPTIQLIASGGIRHQADIDTLQKIGCKGAIVGKAIYEGHLLLK